MRQVFFFSIPSHSINNAAKCSSAVKEFNFQRRLDNFMDDLKRLSLTTEWIPCRLPNGFLLTVEGQLSCRKYKALQLIYDPVRCVAYHYSVVVAFAKKKVKLKTCVMEKCFAQFER